MIITKKYVFTFGKYKGSNVLDVCDTDPHYVLWCADNVDWFELIEWVENYAMNSQAYSESGHDESDYVHDDVVGRGW